MSKQWEEAFWKEAQNHLSERDHISIELVRFISDYSDAEYSTVGKTVRLPTFLHHETLQLILDALPPHPAREKKIDYMAIIPDEPSVVMTHSNGIFAECDDFDIKIIPSQKDQNLVIVPPSS